MRIHITNWQIPIVTKGETIVNANPPGKIVGASTEVDSHGQSWLRLVSVEKVERDGTINVHVQPSPDYQQGFAEGLAAGRAGR